MEGNAREPPIFQAGNNQHDEPREGAPYRPIQPRQEDQDPISSNLSVRNVFEEIKAMGDEQAASFEHDDALVGDVGAQPENENENSQSDETVESDIANEDEQHFANEQEVSQNNYNQFDDKVLFMRSMQWQKDSHGLFDYEMRQIIQANYKVQASKVAVRKGSVITFDEPGINVKDKYGNEGQELFKVHKIRNKYFIVGVDPEDPHKDIDDFYLEAGEPILPPNEMGERMYNAVKFLKRNNNILQQDYLLKKHDIIKMGRVKLKVKEIHLTEKDSQRKLKAKRHKKRIENEKVNNKLDEMQIDSGAHGQQSKYPKNYENISLASDKSDYEPFVGERNYVEAVVPEVIPSVKNSAQKSLHNQDEEQKVELPVGPPSAYGSRVPPVSCFNNRKNAASEQGSNSDDQGDMIILPHEQIQISGNPVQPAQNQEANQLRGRQTVQNQNQIPRNQRDLTGNARVVEEEKKDEGPSVQPSTILQQIQSDLGAGQFNAPKQNSGVDGAPKQKKGGQASMELRQIKFDDVDNDRIYDSHVSESSYDNFGADPQRSVGLNIDKNLIPSKMQEMAQRQRQKKIDKENQGQNSLNMIQGNPSDNYVNLSQLIRIQDDGERSEISHTSQSMSISQSGFTPKVGLGQADGGGGGQDINNFNNLIQQQAAREQAQSNLVPQVQAQRRAPKNQIPNQVSQPLKFSTAKNGAIQNKLERSFSSSSCSSSLSSHQDESVEDREKRNQHKKQKREKKNAEKLKKQNNQIQDNGNQDNIQGNQQINQPQIGPQLNLGALINDSESSLPIASKDEESKNPSPVKNNFMPDFGNAFGKKIVVIKEQPAFQLVQNSVLQSDQPRIDEDCVLQGDQPPQIPSANILINPDFQIPIPTAPPSDSDKSLQENAKKALKASVQSLDQSDQTPICRLCWDSDYDDDNPLLQICQCRGGVEFIHFFCLRSWLKTKEYRQNSIHFTSVYWRQFQCEICKTSLPYVFRSQERNYCLIELPEITTDYLILESLTLESKHSRMVHILHPKHGFNGRYQMGRGQECELKVSDISVSRNHCMIVYDNGKFRLQDSKSKFGTLCLARGMIEILPDTTTGMQIGRTLIIFQTRDLVHKDYNIGLYIQTKNRDGLSLMEKERKELLEKQLEGYKEVKNSKNMTVEEKIEKLNLREFDYQQYVIRNKNQKLAQIEFQQMDHDILMAIEQDRLDEFNRQKEIEDQQKHSGDAHGDQEQIVIREPQVVEEEAKEDQQIPQNQVLVQPAPQQESSLVENEPSDLFKKAQEYIESKGGPSQDIARHSELNRNLNNAQAESRKEKIEESKSGRVFITLRQQDKFQIAQRARLVQEESKGEPVPQIEGQKAPKKVAIGQKFANKSHLTICEMQKKALKLQVEQELKHINEKSQELLDLQEDIKSLEDMDQRHQNLRECQSQIHLELQDIWRVKLQSQKEQAERIAQKEQRDRNRMAAKRAEIKLAEPVKKEDDDNQDNNK